MGDLNYRIDGLADDVVKMRAIVATTVDTAVSKIKIISYLLSNNKTKNGVV